MSSTYSFGNSKCLTNWKYYSEDNECEVSSYDNLSQHSYEWISPSNLRVFDNAREKLKELHNPNIQKNSFELMDKIKGKILQRKYMNDNFFSEFVVSEQEDESVLIEWIFNNLRIGFNVEEDKEQSTYFIVERNDEKHMISSKSAYLKENLYDQTLNEIVNLLSVNT